MCINMVLSQPNVYKANVGVGTRSRISRRDAGAFPKAFHQNALSTWYVLILQTPYETRAITSLIAQLYVWDEWEPALILKGRCKNKATWLEFQGPCQKDEEFFLILKFNILGVLNKIDLQSGCTNSFQWILQRAANPFESYASY